MKILLASANGDPLYKQIKKKNIIEGICCNRLFLATFRLSALVVYLGFGVTVWYAISTAQSTKETHFSHLFFKMWTLNSDSLDIIVTSKNKLT